MKPNTLKQLAVTVKPYCFFIIIIIILVVWWAFAILTVSIRWLFSAYKLYEIKINVEKKNNDLK